MTARLAGASADVLLCTFDGIHTVASLKQIRERMAQRMDEGIACAFVNDYRSCVLAVNTEDAQQMSTIGVMPQPGAFVCSPVQAATMSAWAARVAANGTIRRVFSELCPAVEWAEKQARLWGRGHP